VRDDAEVADPGRIRAPGVNGGLGSIEGHVSWCHVGRGAACLAAAVTSAATGEDGRRIAGTPASLLVFCAHDTTNPN
jgi:hypothetical protein